MEEDDLLGHRSKDRGTLVHKLAFERRVHVIEKEKYFSIQEFFRETFSISPEIEYS